MNANKFEELENKRKEDILNGGKYCHIEILIDGEDNSNSVCTLKTKCNTLTILKGIRALDIVKEQIMQHSHIDKNIYELFNNFFDCNAATVDLNALRNQNVEE